MKTVYFGKELYEDGFLKNPKQLYILKYSFKGPLLGFTVNIYSS